MSREKGTFELSSTIERKKYGNLDATKYVPTYNDLFLFDDSNYMYNGAIVEVWDTNPDLRGVYQLINESDLSNPNSWVRIISDKSGTSGTSGVVGPSGSSGTSGVVGPSGSSGTSGVVGPSGTSGTSGSSGTSGLSGTSGESGTSGTSGSAGTSGVVYPINILPLQTTSFTLEINQQNSYIQCSGDTTITVTIPTNNSVPFNVGTVITFEQTGVGQLQIEGDTDVITTGDNKSFARYAIIQIIKTGTDNWNIIGGI